MSLRVINCTAVSYRFTVYVGYIASSPRGSFRPCARTATAGERPRLPELGNQSRKEVRTPQTNAKALSNSWEIPHLVLISIPSFGHRLVGRLTGSTANFVTASSPEAFKQTFPSGTLESTSEWRPRSLAMIVLTGAPCEHFLRVPEAIPGKLLDGFAPRSTNLHVSLGNSNRRPDIHCSLVLETTVTLASAFTYTHRSRS